MTSPIADMVAQMMAAGVTADTIVLAVRTAELAMQQSIVSTGIPVESPVDITAEKRRAYDRERKRNARVSGGKSGGIPPESAECPKSTISFLREDKNKKERKIDRGRTIPPDWRPSDTHYSEGEKRGFTRTRVDEFATDMRLWAEANKNRAVARKSNWDMTFSVWLRRQKPDGPPIQSSIVPISAWKPGLPTSDELRAKYAEKSKGNAAEQPPSVDENGARPRQSQPELVRSHSRIAGTQSLGGVLRRVGVVSQSFQDDGRGADVHGTVPVAGMATSGNKTT